jgi:hypothetical protein
MGSTGSSSGGTSAGQASISGTASSGGSGGPSGASSGAASGGHTSTSEFSSNGGAGGTSGASLGSSGTGGGPTGGSSTGSTCPQPFVVCDGTCTDTRYDPANCGGCDAPCLAGQSCSDGTCAGVPTGGDAGYQCSPGLYLCVGEQLWQCALEGDNAQFIDNCPTYLEAGDGQTGICQTSDQNPGCPSADGACCCVTKGCQPPS